VVKGKVMEEREKKVKGTRKKGGREETKGKTEGRRENGGKLFPETKETRGSDKRKVKIKLRKWMIYSAMAFAWIGGIVTSAAVVFPTSGVVNGVCYRGVFAVTETSNKAIEIWEFLSFYVVFFVFLSFIFCC